jgi:hypothetical protein
MALFVATLVLRGKEVDHVAKCYALASLFLDFTLECVALNYLLR